VDGIVFGTAGTPISAKGEGSLAGIGEIARLGLGCFEFEFVQSARMAPEKSAECGEAAKRLGILLSAHAPYYVNLIALEEEKQAASVERIIATCRILQNAGGGEVVFHPGFYQGRKPEDTFEDMKAQFVLLLGQMKAEKLDRVFLSPETTGKHSAWGSLDELVRLCKALGGWEKCRLTVDFGHMHARTNGGLKKREDFEAILDLLKSELGSASLKSLHCHMAGIHFSIKGELYHKTIDSKSPDYSLLWPTLAEYKCGGTIISESPNIETDALAAKKEYEKAVAKRG